MGTGRAVDGCPAATGPTDQRRDGMNAPTRLRVDDERTLECAHRPPVLPAPTRGAPHHGSPHRPAPTLQHLRALSANGVSRRQQWNAIQWKSLTRAFSRVGVRLPQPPHAPSTTAPQLNKPLQAAMSDFIRRTRPSLQEFVELVRCQTIDDYRPNKALLPAVLARQCQGYENIDEPIRFATEWVRVKIREPLPRQPRFPKNHPSTSERIHVIRTNIRREQDLLRCLVVDADIIDIWPELFISPFGVVAKGDGDPRVTGRVIHDLSFPDGTSVNDHTDRTDLPTPTFEHCSSIAREITRRQHDNPDPEVMVMAGDIASAYRDACTHSGSVYLFAGHIPEDNVIVIDMSAAFGWAGSGGVYSVLGGAVAYIHGNNTDAAHPHGFYNYHWVDDHVNVSADVGSQCADTETSLRFAMTTVMGPAAVNEDKFTPWSTRQKVLGLIFDTVDSTVAMPGSKITKVKQLVADAILAVKLGRPATGPGNFPSPPLAHPRLGGHSRRSAVVVARPSRPVYERVPLAFFGDLPEPDITVVTDASGLGICALDTRAHRALTYRFLPTEQALIEEFNRGTANAFDINYRELLARAFAVHAWGPSWSAAHQGTGPLHIHFRIDNTTAISWQSKMSSRNPHAQVLIRLLSAWELQFGLCISSSHIPGIENTAADRISRHPLRQPHARMDSHRAAPELHHPQRDLARHLREHSVAASSFKAYEQAFKFWKRWARTRGIPWQLTLLMNEQIQVITEFVIDGSRDGFGSQGPVRGSTVTSALFGIRHFMTAAGYDFPMGHPQVRMLLKGVSRRDAPRKQKAPVSVALLEHCADGLDLMDPADQALWGVLCLAFFFLLRRSEIVATTRTSFRWFALTAEDISTIDAAGLPTADPSVATATCIRLRGSKTNQGGAPVTRMLSRSGHPLLCPVLGALLLRQARGRLPPSIPAAVFTGKNGVPSCVTMDRLANAIQRAARGIGEDPTRYSAHSLRSGGATCMYKAGVDALKIQFHGRWASDTYKIYSRLNQESVASVAAMMTGRAERPREH